MQTNAPIHNFLNAYCALNAERGHVPGHNGLINPRDITEINKKAIDIIKESELITTETLRSFDIDVKRTIFSASGSSLSICAMLAPFAGKRVVAFRGAHRSLIDAAILLSLKIDWVYTNEKMLGEDLTEVISPETSAVFATNIDYYGNVSNVKKIAEVCRSYNLPLLADNAHGAYLVFTDSHPIKNGATMSADSAHKTLPVLTGGGYLHLSDSDYYPRVKDAMKLFGTSSPSYLILESLDLCNIHLAEEKYRALTAFKVVADLKVKLRDLGFAVLETDLLRVVIDASLYGYGGNDFAEEAVKRGVICELSDHKRVVLMFSTITEEKNGARVLEAFKNIPRKPPINIPDLTLPKLKAVCSPREAYFSPKKTLSLKEAPNKVIGETCAGIYAPVPPCVPVIIPGEIIVEEIAEVLRRSGFNEIEVML